MKYKYDQYEIYYKHYSYKVVIFPHIDEAWCYDSHPSEPTYDIQGSITAMKEFAKAIAVVIQDPGVVVYIPMKRPTDECGRTFNVVLTRKPIRLSTWYRLKHRICKKLKTNNYVLKYNQKKLCDYVDRGLLPSDVASMKRDDLMFRQIEDGGDDLLCLYSINDLYRFHNQIIEACNYLEANPNSVWSCWGVGFVVNDYEIKEMLEKEQIK